MNSAKAIKMPCRAKMPPICAFDIPAIRPPFRPL
jgi:hypothetical protein